MASRRALFAFGAGLAARTFILIRILVASFRTICPKPKVSIRYSTFEPAQPSNHLPVTVGRTLFVSRGHLRIYCVLLIKLALFGSRGFFVVPWLLWSRGPVDPVVLLWRRGSHRCRGPVVPWFPWSLVALWCRGCCGPVVPWFPWFLVALWCRGWGSS